MQVAVVGGGVFGCSAAIVLSEQGHNVHLYEKADKLLGAASYCNQYRLHMGYHYPRSDSTAQECKNTVGSFVSAFPDAIVDNNDNFYAIAKKDSKVTPQEYIDFLHRNSLNYKVENDMTSKTELTIRVRELRYDTRALHKALLGMLQRTGVTVHLNTEIDETILRIADKVVLCAYSSNNKLANRMGGKPPIAQYELCEKPVIRLPAAYSGFSMVVMDGPFCSLDPAGRSGNHVLGHVKHAIHKTYKGHSPEDIWYDDADLLNQGIIANPRKSNAPEMMKAARDYFPMLSRAKYLGSMFTIRTVKNDVDATDERPTIVEYIDDSRKVIRVFSGKIGTCVDAAQKVARFVGR